MKYNGGCHCGAVTYEVEADLERVIECNCTHCDIKGLILTFVPVDKFKLLSGEDNLQDYQFNKKKIHHLFCKTCGVESFGRGQNKAGEKLIAINVRCLQGVDRSKLVITPVNGKEY
jgi:hypothetical protein